MNPPASALLDAPPVTETVNHEVTPEPARPPRSAPPTGDFPKPTGGFRRGLWTFVKAVFVLALVVAVGLGVAFGWTELDKRLSTEAQSTGANFVAVDERIAADATRIADLEEQVSALTSDAASLQSRLDGVDSSLTALADEQATTSNRLSDLQQQIDSQSASIESLTESQQAIEATTLDLEGDLAAGLDIARSMELLSRAQLYLYQANYGLALADLTAAREILAAVEPGDGVPTADALDVAVARLDLAIAALPDQPVLAADDLNIAWKLLLGDTQTTFARSFPPVVVAPVEVVEPAAPAEPADP